MVRVDDDLSRAFLVAALKGQNVVISAVGPAGTADQIQVANAMIEAGVRRFIPSEYGFDNTDPKVMAVSPVFRPKGEVAFHLDALAKEHPDFSWTGLATSIWLDWALDVNFIDILPRKYEVVYWDDGTHAPSMSTLPYAAQGVLQILKHPDKFKNQRVFSEAFTTSQREIVTELEKQQGVTYKASTANGAETLNQAHDSLASGFSTETATTIRAGLWLPGYKANFVAVKKNPILEQEVGMPKLTLQDIVKEYLDTH